MEKPSSQTTITCPKCQAYHALGHTYCVNCGWELKRPFTEPTGTRSGGATAPRIQLEPMAEVESADRVEHSTSAASTPAQPTEMKPETETASTDSVSSETVTPEPITPEPISTSDAGEGEGEEVPAEPVDPEPVVPAPVISRPITPARFTQQGLDLLGLGKFQEAIDQFTKAIALDATYSSAWEHRAEAYARQGRDDKAVEDRRTLESLQQQPAD